MKRLIIKFIEEDTETGESRVVDESFYKGAVVLGELEDGRAAEILARITLMDVAALIASSKKVKHAAKLAAVMESVRKDEIEDMVSDMEDELADLIGGEK